MNKQPRVLGGVGLLLLAIAGGGVAYVFWRSESSTIPMATSVESGAPVGGSNRPAAGELAATTSSSAPDFGFVAPEKRAVLEQLERDYRAMETAIHDEIQSMMLPEDREALRLLAVEKQRDLQEILTPAELEEYELRFSSTARELRRNLSAIDSSREEFRQVFELEREFDREWRENELDAARASDSEYSRRRREAAQRLAESIKAFAGEERGELIVWSHDPEFVRLANTARAGALPAELPAEFMRLREAAGFHGSTIIEDRELKVAQKYLALSTLADEVEAQLRALLSGEQYQMLGDAALSWIDALRHGRVIVYDPVNRTVTYKSLGKPPRADRRRVRGGRS